jgi:uncharacterized protein with HEPN domain
VSPRFWKDRIRDILGSIAEIQKHVRGMDFEAFREDSKTIQAVELNFIIIGEAASQIPEEVEDAHPEIPWSLMRAMRNRIAHVYFSIDPRLLWDTIQNDLPPLIPMLEKLL